MRAPGFQVLRNIAARSRYRWQQPRTKDGKNETIKYRALQSARILMHYPATAKERR